MPEDDTQIRIAVAGLIAAMVAAIDDNNPGVRDSFVNRCSEVGECLRYSPLADTAAVETISWTLRLLTDLRPR